MEVKGNLNVETVANELVKIIDTRDQSQEIGVFYNRMVDYGATLYCIAVELRLNVQKIFKKINSRIDLPKDIFQRFVEDIKAQVVQNEEALENSRATIAEMIDAARAKIDASLTFGLGPVPELKLEPKPKRLSLREVWVHVDDIKSELKVLVSNDDAYNFDREVKVITHQLDEEARLEGDKKVFPEDRHINAINLLILRACFLLSDFSNRRLIQPK